MSPRLFSRQAAQGSATAIAAAKTDYEAKNADAVAAHHAKQAEKAAAASSSAKDKEGSAESNVEASEYEQILEAAAGSAQQAGDLDALHEYFGQVLYCIALLSACVISRFVCLCIDVTHFQ